MALESLICRFCEIFECRFDSDLGNENERGKKVVKKMTNRKKFYCNGFGVTLYEEFEKSIIRNEKVDHRENVNFFVI